MKSLLFLITVALFLFSCESTIEENNHNQTINPNNIHIGEVRHDSLSKEQIEKITTIQSVFSKVYPISLEESISNFKRDLNPDNEIIIWLSMADAYKKYISSKPQSLNLETRKEIFRLLLSRSMMSSEEAIENSNLSILTEKEAQEVLDLYHVDAVPLKVIEE